MPPVPSLRRAVRCALFTFVMRANFCVLCATVSRTCCCAICTSVKSVCCRTLFTSVRRACIVVPSVRRARRCFAPVKGRVVLMPSVASGRTCTPSQVVTPPSPPAIRNTKGSSLSKFRYGMTRINRVSLDPCPISLSTYMSRCQAMNKEKVSVLVHDR